MIDSNANTFSILYIKYFVSRLKCQIPRLRKLLITRRTSVETRSGVGNEFFELGFEPGELRNETCICCFVSYCRIRVD